MKQLWKVGLAIVAVLILAGAAVGFVSAQTDSEVPGSDFAARLAEKLGISQEELQGAIDETGLEIVDEAVADGSLTEEQGDRIRDRIESGDGMFPFGGFGRGFAKGFHVGVGVGRLEASLDDVAEFMGISTDELKTFLLDKCEERLAQAVEDGRITQDQADEQLENAPDRIDDLINKEGPLGHWGGRFGGPCQPEAEGTTDTTL